MEQQASETRLAGKDLEAWAAEGTFEIDAGSEEPLSTARKGDDATFQVDGYQPGAHGRDEAAGELGVSNDHEPAYRRSRKPP
jgi:hypothetical protein